MASLPPAWMPTEKPRAQAVLHQRRECRLVVVEQAGVEAPVGPVVRRLLQREPPRRERPVAQGAAEHRRELADGVVQGDADRALGAAVGEELQRTEREATVGPARRGAVEPLRRHGEHVLGERHHRHADVQLAAPSPLAVERFHGGGHGGVADMRDAGGEDALLVAVGDAEPLLAVGGQARLARHRLGGAEAALVDAPVRGAGWPCVRSCRRADRRRARRGRRRAGRAS